jgi:acyl-CoA synthetase (NDP forming)
LSAYGIPTLPTVPVTGLEAAVAAAESLGWPVVLKAGSPQLVHKSEMAGVALRLAGSDQLRAAWSAMARRLGESMGGGLVQPMAAPGVEVIVGVVQDPSFGPLVAFGSGGITADLVGDRAYRLLPMTGADATELVRSLRASPLLFGYRGSPPTDVAALEDLLLRVARLADEHRQIAELDLNPVVVSPAGVTVVDAKARIDPMAAPAALLPTRELSPPRQPAS